MLRIEYCKRTVAQNTKIGVISNVINRKTLSSPEKQVCTVKQFLCQLEPTYNLES